MTLNVRVLSRCASVDRLVHLLPSKTDINAAEKIPLNACRRNEMISPLRQPDCETKGFPIKRTISNQTN